MRKQILTLIGLIVSLIVEAQVQFDYQLQLTPVVINNLPGLHSLVKAQHNGKWLLIGGRKDGVHARQPFNAFPEAQNNTNIYVVDVNANQVWSASVTSLPTAITRAIAKHEYEFLSG
jgi:hypothetical protein